MTSVQIITIVLLAMNIVANTATVVLLWKNRRDRIMAASRLSLADVKTYTVGLFKRDVQ